jgi:transposase
VSQPSSLPGLDTRTQADVTAFEGLNDPEKTLTIFSPFVLTSLRDPYDVSIMGSVKLQAELRASEERHAELRRELSMRCAEQQSLRAEHEALRIAYETLHAEYEAQCGLPQTLPRASTSDPNSLSTPADELAAARHDYAALVDAAQTVTQERDALRDRVAELEAANKRLVDLLWGRRSERRPDSPGQLCLDFSAESLEPTSPEQQEVLTAQAQADEAFDQELLRRLEERRKARRAKRTRSESFPAHLPRRVRVIDLPEEEKAGLKLLGIKVTERLRFEKPTVYVEEIRRYEYVTAGRPEEGVKSAPAPLAIIEGCKYDFSIIAAMVAMKMAFHIPTYRQQDWFAQSGWFPSRSTVNDLFNYSVDTIGPLYDQMWQLLLQQPILLGDDTRLRVLVRNALSAEELAQLEQRSDQPPAGDTGPPANTGPPGSATSFAWLYTGLEGLAEYNIFHWSLTHQNAVIDAHLATFQGIFVGDACGANARLQQRSGGRIEHASCNAHARREFVAAESSEPVLASQALSLYRQLYDVEERGKTLPPDERWVLRQRDAVPIWKRMRQWLDSATVQNVLPKSALGQAVGYLRNQWSALQVYLRDGRLPIDNDQSEQTIRPLTVGRSNWLFLGHPRAAAGRLKLYSLVSSAHRHHLVIHDYLEDVLPRLADAQQNHPADLELGAPYLLNLLPDRWALAHPQSVRQERREENELVSEIKLARRAQERVEARAAKARVAS